jgi:hypothetical protein
MLLSWCGVRPADGKWKTNIRHLTPPADPIATLRSNKYCELAWRLLSKKPAFETNNLAGFNDRGTESHRAKSHNLAGQVLDSETNPHGIREPKRATEHLSGRVKANLRLSRLTRERLAVKRGPWAMTDPSPRTVLLKLSETDNLGPITVDAENFGTFEEQFEEQLEKLVEAWKHVASPNAQRIRRSVTSQ